MSSLTSEIATFNYDIVNSRRLIAKLANRNFRIRYAATNFGWFGGQIKEILRTF